MRKIARDIFFPKDIEKTLSVDIIKNITHIDGIEIAINTSFYDVAGTFTVYSGFPLPLRMRRKLQ